MAKRHPQSADSPETFAHLRRRFGRLVTESLRDATFRQANGDRNFEYYFGGCFAA